MSWRGITSSIRARAEGHPKNWKLIEWLTPDASILTYNRLIDSHNSPQERPA